MDLGSQGNQHRSNKICFFFLILRFDDFNERFYLILTIRFSNVRRFITLLIWQLCLCAIILSINGGIYSLTSISNDIFFEKLFMRILFILRDFTRFLKFRTLDFRCFKSFLENSWEHHVERITTHYLCDISNFVVQNFLLQSLDHR